MVDEMVVVVNARLELVVEIVVPGVGSSETVELVVGLLEVVIVNVILEEVVGLVS